MAKTPQPTERADQASGNVVIEGVEPGESVLAYVRRTASRDDPIDVTLYRQILGAANPFKEGDRTIGVAAANEESRQRARSLVSHTRVQDLSEHSIFEDSVSRLIDSSLDRTVYESIREWTIAELCSFTLREPESEIKKILPGLPSDAIACLVRIATNEQLIEIGQRIFHPLAGRSLGARGYMGARIQPNSPTDDVDDIVWQVFCAFSYAVGDFLIGTNPVDSTPESVTKVELALQDLIETFGLQDTLPHCVLSHIDVQAEVERRHPGSTGVWFQSLAGCESANATFGISVEKMMGYASMRTGRYGMYLETGQGADFTNGHGHGFDMVLHEARKYGFARALQQRIAEVHQVGDGPWVHVNDVAGFIGPEVFRTREQLVRTCLEDIVMGKMHGLTIGLDICSTLHMQITPDDLDWCIEQIMPANPAYLMALPTKNDPMLSYLTTAYQDHVRVRERFGFKVDDQMWSFYRQLGILDSDGHPTRHFGDPIHVYQQYRRLRGDKRTDDSIRADALDHLNALHEHGVPLATGHGEQPWDLRPELKSELEHRYTDAKRCLWTRLTEEFTASVDGAISIRTLAADREDYVSHPELGEQFPPASIAALKSIRDSFGGQSPDSVLVISDGLNALAIGDEGHAIEFIARLKSELSERSITIAPTRPIIENGRVRAGYQVGRELFGSERFDKDGPTDRGRSHAIIHVIGERPGSGHHNFSVYLTVATPRAWSEGVDHNLTKVVSGISDTALDPADAARQISELCREQLRANDS